MKKKIQKSKEKNMKKLKWNNIFILLILMCLTLIGCNSIKNNNLDPYKEEDSKKEYNLSIFSVGDVLLHGWVMNDAKTGSSYDFKPMFSYLKEIVNDYDLAFYNQESSIGGANLGYSGYPRFNSPDAIGTDMIEVGFDLVSLTNNHTMDQGITGASYSAKYWSTKSAYTAGSYVSKDERDKVVIKEKNGITYTLLAYTTVTNGLTPPAGYEYLTNIYSETKVKADVEKVRDKVDIVMVSMHWGEENVYSPTSSQQQQANYLASLGVDVIIGHHSHTVQPITFINNTLVIYSLGNCLSNQKDVSVGNNIGLMVGFNINKVVEDGVSTIKITDIKGDLLWVDSQSHHNYKVVPLDKVTNSTLSGKDSVYAQYS